MANISGIGVYVPRYRIEASEINSAWGRSGGRGQKSVASADEDVLTMGIQAAHHALESASISIPSIGAVYFASVSARYIEYALASQVSRVLGLGSEVSVADFGLSTRSTMAAIQTAVDAVNSGRVENALVIASDILIAEPGSAYELNYGAGAAAAIISNSGAVELQKIISRNSDFLSRSRQEGAWHGLVDDRFIMKHGFIDEIAALAQQLELDFEAIDHVVVQAPDPRWTGRLLKKLKLTPEKLYSSAPLIGYAGCASLLIDLALAIENAETGQEILAIAYGPGGVDLSELTSKKKENRGQSIQEGLTGHPLLSYPQYLRNYGLLGGHK